MALKLKRFLAGQIELPDGKVDVTDPCYEKDVYFLLRLDNVEVAPGTYNCYAYMGIPPTERRCWIAQIVIADGPLDEIAEDKIMSGKSWRRIGSIGVDAGMAGFFSHKPDFNDDEWDEVCATESCASCDAYIKDFAKEGTSRQGFWTDSGYGDGVYPVYAIRENRKIIALEIRY